MKLDLTSVKYDVIIGSIWTTTQKTLLDEQNKRMSISTELADSIDKEEDKIVNFSNLDRSINNSFDRLTSNGEKRNELAPISNQQIKPVRLPLHGGLIILTLTEKWESPFLRDTSHLFSSLSSFISLYLYQCDISLYIWVRTYVDTTNRRRRRRERERERERVREKQRKQRKQKDTAAGHRRTRLYLIYNL